MDVTSTPAIIPIAYDPSFEKQEAGEAETAAQIRMTMADIREKTYKDSGHAMRSVHVKSHGLLKGELQVPDDLPDYLSQGIFSHPGTYPLLMRLSTSPGDLLPDSVSTPRGCALKIIGVKGERLPDTENGTTQDFVMVNGGSTFMAGNLKQFLPSLKALAAGVDKATGAKEAVSAVLQGVEKVIEGLGGTSPAIRGMGGEPQTNPLGETYYSQAPILFGKYMAKISLVPISPSLTHLTGEKIDASENPNILRDTVNNFFATNDAVWELRAQLSTDKDKMPIEDTATEWPEDLSPYLTVATIVIKAQTGWSEARSGVMDDKISFSPWHGVVAHRPLGSVMRARRDAYKESAAFRKQKDSATMEEPSSTDILPD